MKKQIMKKLRNIMSAITHRVEIFLEEKNIIEKLKFYKFGNTDDV